MICISFPYFYSNDQSLLPFLSSSFLKGGGHGHFHIAFYGNNVSLGGAENQDSIFKIFRMH